MEGKRINVGPLNSFNSLVYHLSTEFKAIRESYLKGETPKFYFDLTNIGRKNMHISALTAFLCIGKKLSDFVGYPIPVFIFWDPEILQFLNSIHFFEISNKLKIFEFLPEGIIGGFRKEKYVFNPNSKIMYYADVHPIKNIPVDDIGMEKAKHKQKLSGNFKLACSNIFRGINSRLENRVANAALELIVNSLMHAEDIAFVGLQRTSRKIVVTICDAGIGFPKALYRIYKKESFNNLTHAQGIFIGSLIQRKEHGLRLAISEILNYKEFDILDSQDSYGWVVVSSYNSEIRWEKRSWDTAVKAFDKVDIFKQIPPLESVLGASVKDYVDKDNIIGGYWKTYSHYLIGTRISFEIILE